MPLTVKPAGTHVLFYVIGIDFVAYVQSHLVGHLTRYQHFARSHRISKVRDTPLYQVVGQEGGVVLLRDAFQDDALEIVLGLQHAGLDGKALYVLYSGRGLTDDLTDAVASYDGTCLVHICPTEIGHLDVGAEANDLIPDLLLEAQSDGHREHHHHQTDGYPYHGDSDGRT